MRKAKAPNPVGWLNNHEENKNTNFCIFTVYNKYLLYLNIRCSKSLILSEIQIKTAVSTKILEF